jgi:hypothetical protein
VSGTGDCLQPAEDWIIDEAEANRARRKRSGHKSDELDRGIKKRNGPRWKWNEQTDERR